MSSSRRGGATGRGRSPRRPTSAQAVPSPFCLKMCSEREMVEREACMELSRLEILRGTENFHKPKVNPSLAVKRYRRPAAGDPPPQNSELRPLHVLKQTVEHLLRLWQSRTDEPALYRYHFISDRLRAVQQDITVQGLGIAAAPLLAQCVRFHLLMEVEFYGMRDATTLGFSAVQNRSLLCNALISALEHVHELEVALASELMGYLVLLHVEHPDVFMQNLVRAPATVTSSSSVARALRMTGAFSRGDFVDLGRLLQSAPILDIACILRLMPEAIASILKQCNAAFTARERFPCALLAKWLWLPTPQLAAEVAVAHGLDSEAADGSSNLSNMSLMGSPSNQDAQTAASSGQACAVRFKSRGFNCGVHAGDLPLTLPSLGAFDACHCHLAKDIARRAPTCEVNLSSSADKEWAWRLMSTLTSALPHSLRPVDREPPCVVGAR